MTRIAISPRLAMRIFLNMADGSSRPYRKEPLAVLHRLAIFHIDVDDLAVILRVDLVHQLHRLDDAEHVALLDRRADVDEGGGARLRRPVERPDDRRFHD